MRTHFLFLKNLLHFLHLRIIQTKRKPKENLTDIFFLSTINNRLNDFHYFHISCAYVWLCVQQQLKNALKLVLNLSQVFVSSINYKPIMMIAIKKAKKLTEIDRQPVPYNMNGDEKQIYLNVYFCFCFSFCCYRRFFFISHPTLVCLTTIYHLTYMQPVCHPGRHLAWFV